MDTQIPPLTQREFALYKVCLKEIAGINLRDSACYLIESRIGHRVSALGLSYSSYLDLITQSVDEKEIFLNRMSTNETYFFRESEHFTFLEAKVLPALQNRPYLYRAWSAASSSGEEAYTLAMVLDNALGKNRWEIIGSDISTQMIEQARSACYTSPRLQYTPDFYRKKYMLQGIKEREGQVKIIPYLRNHVTFHKVNLKEDLPDFGLFDVIFLRNVLIYFDAEMRTHTVAKLLRHLKPGGYLITSIVEVFPNTQADLKFVQPGIYCKN